MPTSPVPATTTSKPADPTASVAKVTAACPLLSVDELKTLLGGSASRTKITATEDPPDVSGDHANYTCEYGSNGKTPFALSVVAVPETRQTPQVVIDAIGKASNVSTHPVAGVGEAAVFYTLPDGNSLLATSKRAQGEVRTVLFSAPAVVPEQKFVDLTRLVIGKL